MAEDFMPVFACDCSPNTDWRKLDTARPATGTFATTEFSEFCKKQRTTSSYRKKQRIPIPIGHTGETGTSRQAGHTGETGIPMKLAQAGRRLRLSVEV